MSSRHAVVTVCTGKEYRRIAAISHPPMKQYARAIGADFIDLGSVRIPHAPSPHWKKLALHDILGRYDRAVYFDTDILIRRDCPDLFQVVPSAKVGVLDEGKRIDRQDAMVEAVAKYRHPVRWCGTYYNTGVMVLSRSHRGLFAPPARMIQTGMYEQSLLNLRLLSGSFPIYPLPMRFNTTLVMPARWRSRLDAYIIHYAGFAYHGYDTCAQMKEDKVQWRSRM
jgi:lipopolysaccharide biosynthesis glycosyltransferase